jgi:hypothetical protein
MVDGAPVHQLDEGRPVLASPRSCPVDLAELGMPPAGVPEIRRVHSCLQPYVPEWLQDGCKSNQLGGRLAGPFATRLNQKAIEGPKSNADGPLLTSNAVIACPATERPSRVEGRSSSSCASGWRLRAVTGHAW